MGRGIRQNPGEFRPAPTRPPARPRFRGESASTARAANDPGMDEARAMVLVAEPIPAEAVRWLGERVEVVASAPGEANFAESLARASGLVVRTYTRVDAALLAAAPHLRVVGRAGVGVDNIDLAACAARGVRVVHTPLANADAVVELVLGLVLDVLRPRPLVDRAMSPQEWGALRESLITSPASSPARRWGCTGLGASARAWDASAWCSGCGCSPTTCVRFLRQRGTAPRRWTSRRCSPSRTW